MASEEIKRKMIEVTKSLLHEKAFITIKDIADASYVNIAAVNYHFGSKEKLMAIVLEEVIDELKAYVSQEILISHEKPVDLVLEEVIDYLYKFALDNLGLLNYLFLSDELQKESSGALMKHFFSDNAFTQLIYKSLSKTTQITNEKELQARYVLLFSSFCIPLFLQISQFKLKTPMKIEMFFDPEFRSNYIKGIMKLM